MKELTEREKQLAEALRRARDSARAAKPGGDDGSANLDCAFLRARRGLTTKMVGAAAAAAGVYVSRSHAGMWNGWFLHVATGQGAMRTRMAEAATRALIEAGEDATTYYQID